MEQVYTSLAQRAIDIHRTSVGGASGQRRIIIAFAGPPGSGKSTIAAQVVQRINNNNHNNNTAQQQQQRSPLATCVPMDGFHYSRAYLDRLPNHAEAHARRGAAWTFDADGVVRLVQELSASRFRATETVAILAPSFDHGLKDPVADALRIEPETEIVIVEGNWLLLDRDPWRQIPALVDDTWFVDVEPGAALRRIAARHVAAGVEGAWEDAVVRAERNDLVNGEEVRRGLLEPRVRVRSVDVVEEDRVTSLSGRCSANKLSTKRESFSDSVLRLLLLVNTL